MTDESVSWRGVHISELKCSLNNLQFPEVVNKEDHTVLVQTPIIIGRIPDCFPSIYDKIDCWDSNHVKLPCSEKNVTEDQVNRWSLIREALSSVILSSQQLEATILSYNKRFAERWNFATLRLFFDEVCNEEESAAFFQLLLPKMIDLALCLPELITGGIPTLKQNRTHSVTLSQMQIASLLANAFFITFPHRNSYAKGCEYANYPTINFTRLFQAVFRDRKKATYEKIKCLLHYFRRVTSSPPTGVVTYSRHFVSKLLLPNWQECTKTLSKLCASSTGTIEDEGFGLLQVDFAHKLVGGGVLANGCVQEEIRFIICPELILSRLFTECLNDNEALIVTGCERFSKYKGYGKSFEWDGDYIDETPSDGDGRKYCSIVAIDALFFKRNPKEQYSRSKIDRELNKAYAGFSWGSRRKKEELCGVATGNWGCGVYRGNAELKSLLQLMAAAESNRDLVYFTFGNEELRDSMYAIHNFLLNNSITVGKIYDLLCQYAANEVSDHVSVYEYIKNEALSSHNSKKVTANSDNTAIEKSTTSELPAVTKRSLCYSSKKEVDEGDNWCSNSDLKNAQSTCETENAEIRNLKMKESKALLQLYESTPSTSITNFSDDSDDSFDLDKYRKIKRKRVNTEEIQNSSSETTEHDIISEDEQRSTIIEKQEGEKNFSETAAEDDIKEPDESKPFEPIKMTSRNETRSPNSLSIPLKGLKFTQKNVKNNSLKKKFPDQKTKIYNYFSSS